MKIIGKAPKPGQKHLMPEDVQLIDRHGNDVTKQLYVQHVEINIGLNEPVTARLTVLVESIEMEGVDNE